MRRIRGARIGYVPQDPVGGLDPTRRVRAQIAEVLRVHRIGTRADRRSRVDAALREAGIAEPERVGARYPHELSGGLAQRVLIAQAIVAAPELIIADEPTSALDVTVQKEVLDNLARAAAERGAALLLITHDLAVAAERADRVLVLEGGTLIEQGPARQVLTAPQHAYTRSLVAATPAAIADALRGRTAPTAATPLLQATGLRRTFRRFGTPDVRAVDDVSLSVARGRTLALVGESGSGKTTTARMLSRLEVLDAGSVQLDGAEIGALRGRELRALRRRIQYVHQNPRSALDPRFTVAQAIAEPLRAFGVADAADRVRRLADLVALPAASLGRSTALLSGGQAQRVSIARALALEPSVLVLDEAVSALDVAIQARILDLLTELQRELDLAYVFVSHDLSVVAQIADEVAVMHDGRIVEDGSVARVFTSPEHPYTRRLLAAVPGMRRVA
jgi:peptide/nickel transport system ATP-binding protein